MAPTEPQAETVSAQVCRRVAEAFIDTFNERDADAWAAVFHPDAEFSPTAMTRKRPVYRGQEGARAFMEDLVESGAQHRSRIRDVRLLGGDEFLLLTEILVQGEPVSSGAVVIRVADEQIIAAIAYLSDESTLTALGVIPKSGD